MSGFQRQPFNEALASARLVFTLDFRSRLLEMCWDVFTFKNHRKHALNLLVVHQLLRALFISYCGPLTTYESCVNSSSHPRNRCWDLRHLTKTAFLNYVVWDLRCLRLFTLVECEKSPATSPKNEFGYFGYLYDSGVSAHLEPFILNWIYKEWFYDKRSLELNHPPPELWVFIFYKMESNRILTSFWLWTQTTLPHVILITFFWSHLDLLFVILYTPCVYHLFFWVHLAVGFSFNLFGHESRNWALQKAAEFAIAGNCGGRGRPSGGKAMFFATKGYSPPKFNSGEWWPRDGHFLLGLN